MVEDRWLELVVSYQEEFGHLPTFADLLLLREAESSTALDKGDGQTFSF